MRSLKISLLVFILSITISAQWIKTNPSSPVSCIKITASKIYIGTDGSHIASSYSDGVCKSNDNGSTWQLINNGLTDRTIHAFEVVDTNLFAGTFDGVFKSTDNGECWVPKNVGLPILNITALAAFNDSTLFTAVRELYTFGLYKSTNLGDHWDYVLGGFPINTIAINGSNIFLGTYNGIFRSTDGGLSWSGANGPTSKVSSFTFSGSNIFAGSYSGVYSSTDNGDTWDFLSAGPTNIMALAADEQKIIAGTYDQGIFTSTDLGNTWAIINDGLIDKHILSLSIGDSIVLAGTNFGMFHLTGTSTSWTPCSYTPYNISFLTTTLNYTFAGGSFGVCRSTDNGMSWLNSYSEYLVNDYEYYVTDLISLNNELFASYYNYGVCKSTDYGANWSPVNNWPTGFSVNKFASKGEKLFAVTSPPDIFLSTNGGANWYSVNNGLGNFALYKLIAKEENLFITTEQGVFFSSNDGTTWTQRNNGIQYLNNKEIAIIDSTIFLPSQNGMYYSTNNGLNWLFKEWPYYLPGASCLFPLAHYLFMGIYGGGIYMSSDFGDSWILINDSMPEDYTVSAFTSSGDYLLAGTEGAGIWQRPLSQIITDMKDEESSNPLYYVLYQNYPNPFNPVTKIKFTIPIVETQRDASLRVTLKVYDILGREIATLVNEEKPAGTYEVEFDGTGLPSGIYFYQIKASSFVKTKKMILLK